jgi:hypothetical protein
MIAISDFSIVMTRNPRRIIFPSKSMSAPSSAARDRPSPSSRRARRSSSASSCSFACLCAANLLSAEALSALSPTNRKVASGACCANHAMSLPLTRSPCASRMRLISNDGGARCEEPSGRPGPAPVGSSFGAHSSKGSGCAGCFSASCESCRPKKGNQLVGQSEVGDDVFCSCCAPDHEGSGGGNGRP